MAWTTPKTWTNVLVPASDLNTHIRDNLNHLRDVMLGSQDLGANMVLQGAREIRLSASLVAHGITGILATDQYGSIAASSSSIGGLSVVGISDADALGLVLYGFNGSATGALGGVSIVGAKKNGTSIQPFSGTELVMKFVNATTTMASFLASGDFITEAALGFASGGDEIDYDRGVDAFLFNIAATLRLQVNATGVHSNGGGFSTTSSSVQTNSITMSERASPPSAPPANCGVVWMEDNGSGKTRYMARFPTGANVVICTEP